MINRFVDLSDPKLLVNASTNDDAAVYQIDKERALSFTADFIGPTVDDPYLYGQVAAANALSDIFAMGSTPLIALNLCAFPRNLQKDVMQEILRGGHDKVREAGGLIVGGHTLHDPELKYGLAVVGEVHPDKIWRNSTAQSGDQLILTKPLGTGAIISGVKRGILSEELLLEITRSQMVQLNRKAFEIARAFHVHACTDITGFGLSGHGWEMAKHSKVGLRFFFEALPHYPEAIDILSQGIFTVLTPSNQSLVSSHWRMASGTTLSSGEEMLFHDPQTSGGLLIALDPKEAKQCLGRLHEAGIQSAAIIGEVVTAEQPFIEVFRK